MVITRDLVRTIAGLYTAEQLQMKITDLVQDLESNGSTITSASTGAGASYTRKIEASREELIALYTAALNYKLYGESSANTGQVFNVRFNHNFNL